MVTHRCALRERAHLDSSFGGRDSGSSICEESRTIFQHSMSLIWNDSEGILWETSYVRSISNFLQTPTAQQTWSTSAIRLNLHNFLCCVANTFVLYFDPTVKICQTTHSIRCPSSRYHKSGFGANHGVLMKPNQTPRLLICATIHCTRNPSCQWQRELLAESYSKRAGKNWTPKSKSMIKNSLRKSR